MSHDDKGPWEELSPPPTEQEIEEASALREALEGRGDHPDVILCEALRAAYDPKDLDSATHEHLIYRALAPPRDRRRAGRVIYVAFGASTAALALAAGLVLVLSRGWIDVSDPGGAPAAAMMRSRTTQPLFDAPFPRHGGSSARIDRITHARSRDYRANLFASMGVR